MISIYFFSDPLYWIFPWIIQAIAYFFLLKKMQLKKWTALIPFLAERQFTTKLFRRTRTFYRPFIISAVFAIAAYYLDPAVGTGRLYMWIAFIIYGIFLIRLYWRMGRAMGKGRIFRLFMILLPGLFLLILGLGRSQYEPLPMKPLKEHSKAGRIVRKVCLVTVSVAEILALVLCVGYITILDTPPVALVNYTLNEAYNNTKDVTGTGDVVSREDAMGKAASSVKDMKISRDYFFPDHSKDKNVVVMTYIVGSNLEDKNGLASANIHQMIDATKQGDNLTFVVEAGGSERWFTKGIENGSYGRYTVAGGEVSKVKNLPDDICMAEPENLTDFITWAKKKYPADRYMLVLWDHGGGVAQGYGHDDLNERDVKSGQLPVMRTSEVVSAIKKSGVKFDVIGFDACLMQDIEIAFALEPYADYYLASEETEGGYGWFYTSAFGKLAQDPGTSSADFGREMVACYDPYNRALNTDKNQPDPEATLSFVDLTLAAPAYEQLCGVMNAAEKAINDDKASFADIAGAASNAYGFYGDLQIDLINFLKILDRMDYNEEICSHKEKVQTIRAAQASVLFRNGDSAKGINGISLAFPYKAIEYYSDTSSELKKMSMKSERKLFDEIFSIIAAQQKKDYEKKEKETDDNPSLLAILESAEYEDYTKEPWYIKGFEDYDKTKAYVDIPLKEVRDGYQIELPEKAWKIIADCQTIVYEKTEGEADGSVMRYLGSDYIGSNDADGHPLIAMDETWVHIDGQLVCYEAQPALETDEGDVFTGKVKARLNDKKDVILNVEWDPVADDEETPAQGHVTGYDSDSLLDLFVETKHTNELKAGDTIQFLFDYYDKEGNLVSTKPGGSRIIVSKQSGLTVRDEPLAASGITFGGVLTDVYQRVMTTEMIEE